MLLYLYINICYLIYNFVSNTSNSVLYYYNLFYIVTTIYVRKDKETIYHALLLSELTVDELKIQVIYYDICTTYNHVLHVDLYVL